MAHVSAAQRRPQLIKAAVDLISREGVAAGSTRAIAAELGVAQATVHYVFGSKEALYQAVVEQLTQDLVVQVERAVPEEGGFTEAVTALAAALWSTVREQPTSHQVLTEVAMFALRVPRLSVALESHQSSVIEVTARLVTEAAERTGRGLAVPAETIARFFLAGFDGLTTQRLISPDEEAERMCLEALVSAVIALANGRLDLVDMPRL